MAVSVLVHDKRLIKKKLKIEDFILDGMGYGIIDGNFRLDEGKTGNTVVVFDKKDIVRGFEISIDKDGFHTYMSLPTSDDEIKRFYDYIKKVCELLHAKTFIREEVEVDFTNIDECIELDNKASKDALKSIEENINNGEYKSMYLFGVYNPIALGKKEIEFIDGSPKKLDELLNKLQQIDAYYAAPQIFIGDKKDYLGAFTLIPNVLTIYPLEPTVFMNEEIKVNKWEIVVASNDKVGGALDYNTFLENVDKSNLYDSEHFMIEADQKLIDKLQQYFIKR